MSANKASNITIGGITVALIIIMLYMGSLIRNSSVFILAIATFISAIPYIKGSIKVGGTVYVATSLLAAIIVPDKLYVIYFVFAGVYSFIKLIAEKQKNIVLEFLLKFLYANITLALLYFIVTNIFGIKVFTNFSFDLRLAYLATIVVYQILFFIFDLCFTKFIMLYEKRFNL